MRRHRSTPIPAQAPHLARETSPGAARGLCAHGGGVACARAGHRAARLFQCAIGVNFLVAGYAYTRGGIAFGSLPITNPNLETSSARHRVRDSAGIYGGCRQVRRGRPVYLALGNGRYNGETVARKVDGFSNPAFRLSVNLYGAPALTLKEFADGSRT
jgi:hypothetical protein